MTQVKSFFENDPILAIALAAALIAFATTPIAFAILARMDYFRARRGRVMQKPEFWSVVCSMILVMGIPAIFAGMTLKSRYFDRDRYEFDPNKTISVLDQGRQYASLREADEAVRREMKVLAEERKNLVDGVKKLDEAMIVLRAAANQAPVAAQAMPDVLEKLAGVRKAVGLDGPQQLLDFTAPPAALAGTGAPAAVAMPIAAAVPTAPAAAAPAGNGLSDPEIQVELAAVPQPQKPLASLLPLKDIPAGWVVGKNMGPSGRSRLETFNAANLYDKIDGRAESFVQYGVQGMAYTFYHAAGDEGTEAQLYIFEMGDALKALGKYSSEKPDGSTAVPLGTEGYASAGSVFFHAGKYYTQVVVTKDDPKVAAFALDIAKRVADRLKGELATAAAASPGGKPSAGPDDVFKLLPAEPKRGRPQYVAEDAFGYSFLSEVFLADYQDGDTSYQGFLRPYESPEAAEAAFAKYVETVKKDGAEIKEISGTDAKKMIVASNIGLNDAVFLKGNALAGANGSPDPARAEAFAKAFAKSLPDHVPVIAGEKPKPESAGE